MLNVLHDPFKAGSDWTEKPPAATGQDMVILPGLRVTVTSDPTIAPPGWYMLFLTDNDGVPSVAKWIRLPVP